MSFLRVLLFSLLPAAGAVAQQPAAPGSALPKEVLPVLEKYCYDCHGDGASKGDVILDLDTTPEAILKNRKLWSGVMFHVEQWTMPPVDKKTQPTRAERELLVHWLDNLLNPVDPANPDPGRVTIRRLNRGEYNNTVRDLLGVTTQPANEFPEDDTGYGFDNIGDVLALPPILMERYLIAADRVLLEAVPPGPPQPETSVFTHREMRGVGLPAEKDGGTRLLAFSTEGEATMEYFAPVEGEYLVRVKAWGAQAGPDLVKLHLRVNGKVQRVAEISADAPDKPQVLEERLTFTKGAQTLAVAFLNEFYDPEIPDPKERGRYLYLPAVEVEGPVKSTPRPLLPAAQKFFDAAGGAGETDAGARAILEAFATRAFRRPAMSAEADRLLRLYKAARDGGESWRDSLRIGMKAIMVSPYFLFRIESPPGTPPASGVTEISEFALASRLSYWLWSSLPDEELMALAAKGQLRANLPAQIQRMLKDQKARALPENFGGQWLELRSLAAANPDKERFPEYTPALRDAMRAETTEFFWHILSENRPVTEFLNADYTFVNEALAKFYGIEGVQGPEFRLVKPAAGTHRRGLLTHASILTVTSDSIRTSPVKRGKWLLENILGITAPPPPPNVPALTEGAQVEKTASVRVRLEAHRSKPGCASCHSLIDPLGFGLENFNAIGKWRDKDGDFPVDSTGVLTSGQKFNNAPELVDVLLADRKDVYLRNLARKMLTYALGRGTESYDRPALDAIVTRMEKDGNTFQSLLLAVSESVPFQKRRGDQ